MGMMHPSTDSPVAPTPTESKPTATPELSSWQVPPDSTRAKPQARPPAHTQTQSTLAPTSEFVRYLLLALPARYTIRGAVEALFGKNAPEKVQNFANRFTDFFSGKGTHLDGERRNFVKDVSYDYGLGLGSLALTTTYTRLVYRDILNVFRETVGMELGKEPDKITYWDLTQSNNRIVQRTLNNFSVKTAERYGTDLLFFSRPIPAMRWLPIGDIAIGIKAALAFNDTWKRKTTMFEDLVTFVNNKINPRNGLGQAISVGEIFDLYQHYAQAYTPERVFTNVLEQGTGEGARWAESQPIFQRMTELMNKTYAYKHSTVLDPATGHALHQADFTLPKFVYLLGHDLINVDKPQQTLVTIEIANQYGIGAVKDMQTMLANGRSLEDVTARYQVTLPSLTPIRPEEQTSQNGVIAKGSTMQLEQSEHAARHHEPHPAPVSRIDVRGVKHTPPTHHAALEV